MKVRIACFRSLFALLVLMVSTPLGGCDGSSESGANDAPIAPGQAEPAQASSGPNASGLPVGGHDFTSHPVSGASSEVAADPLKEPRPDAPVAAAITGEARHP